MTDDRYSADGITLICGDSLVVTDDLIRQGLFDPDQLGMLIVDPPFDQPELFDWSFGRWNEWGRPPALVFTDPRTLGRVTETFGGPRWLFVWDTLSPWNLGKAKPLTQVKFAALYGSGEYRRDATLWGDAPPVRNHPSTKQEPLDGRRLVDLWRESLRWLHHPAAGNGSAGSERFTTRQGNPSLRHAKPVGWLKCLIGNATDPEDGIVFDPFLGSGTSALAARDLGLQLIGVEVDLASFQFSVARLRKPETKSEKPLSLFAEER